MTFSKAITSQIYGKKVEKLKGDARVGEKFNFFVIFAGVTRWKGKY